ncbi:MAG: AAA family ATPase [Alistipes sp.]|nr:AAA family ATPase [Alistipes sp.]
MNQPFETTNGSPAVALNQGTEQSKEQPFNGMFAASLKEAEHYEMPTDEEIAEADRILAEAFAPYERRAEYLAEQEYRRAELSGYVEPHLVDLTKPAPIVKPIIEHKGMMVASLGNISAVVGAAKSKKTFLCSALVGGLLAEKGDFGITPRFVKVLWVDTEQSELHARRVVERIHRLAGWSDKNNSGLLRTLTLREVEPKQRAEILYMAIELYRPHLVVVDGISDLMYNTNDIEESDRIVGQLMALSTDFNCHILCVLHTNPNSDKARGHIGSTLQRKAETVIFVHKVGECSVVEPQFCRNEEFEPFAFLIDEEGLPVECDLPKESETAHNDCVKVMQEHYPNGIERGILVDKLESEYGCTYGTAQVKISRALKSGKLISVDGVLQLP